MRSLQESPVGSSYFDPLGRKVDVKTIARSAARLELGGVAGGGKISNVVQVEGWLCDAAPL